MVHFHGTEYRAHTSCMTEAQKYQGHLYRGDKKKGGQQQQQQQQRKQAQGQEQAMVPKAYVEDAPEDGGDLHAIAVIDVPPRAPTPPPATAALENVNVFDFLVQDATPKAAVTGAPGRKLLERESSSMYVNHPNDSQYSQYSNGDGTTYMQRGYSYGDAPVQPTFERYDSLSNLENSQTSLMPPPTAYATPAPKKEKKEKSDKSDKKRKRHQIDDLDLSAAKRPASRGDEPMADAPAPPSTSTSSRVLHSGLTGGLSRLVTDPDFYEDRIDAGPTPISPLKRSKRSEHGKESSSRDDNKRKSSSSRTVASSKPTSETTSRHNNRRHHRSPSSSPEPSARPKSRTKAIEYTNSTRAGSVQPSASNQVGAHYNSRAELFMSFVNKGPDSERGVSINKALKRYHREKGLREGGEKEDEDKELWKGLRLRRNSRGEVVLFV
jgi:cell growth-regulating nucleolar protein